MNQKTTAALLVGGIVVLGGGAARAATLSPSGGADHPTAGAHVATTPATTPRSGVTFTLPRPTMTNSQMAIANSTAPNATLPGIAASAPPTTVAPVVSKPSVALPSAPAVPPGTTNLSVAPGSGAGCSAGITDGNQWIKYTVRLGDTLSSISQCFSLNGYETLYHDNISVLGPNPNLIYPGQVITIVNGKMSVRSS